MEFKESVVTCFTKYVDFNGRASRSEYWWFFLSYIVLYMVGMAIKPVLAALIALAYFLPLLAVGIRRLHDTNRSGWWYLVCLIPLIGAILLIVWFATEGTKGANDFGAPVA